MKKNKGTITYAGGLDELYSLLDDNGNVDQDKLIDWLSSSDNLSYNNQASSTIKKISRKRKIKRLNRLL